MTVLSSVVDAVKAISLPLIVVIAAFPAVETEIPAPAMTVPLNVPPPVPLMVAALPHTQ
jgi:hypothetical protein